jgi:cysteinyl-tRNA synthetase
MPLKLYNTLTRKKEEFKPIEKGKVGMYCCGPTVYDYAHIGNLRTYIFEDLLKRTLLFNNLEVKHVMNITDVGHLTSDADAGEDKLEKSARKEKKSAWDIAVFYTRAFREDIKKLNILSPDIWCKATDHIKEMQDWVSKLIKKGYTYELEDGIYFDTSKFREYGALDPKNLRGIKAGKRVDMGGKKNPADFALWKFSPENEKRQMEWEFLGRKGFPGWHIECSAMSTKYLGENFDIHCGGIDHIQIHHTNEIAQTEAITGKRWVNCWLHGEFLVLDKDKMSKSAGNFFTLPSLEEKGFSPLDYRYLCLNTHYRKRLVFTEQSLSSARSTFKKLAKTILELSQKQDSSGSAKKYETSFLKAVSDDLNIPKALGILWDALKDESLGSREKYSLALKFDKVLGLGLDSLKSEEIPESISHLVEQRETARKNKDFKKSDSLRKKIEEMGYRIEDSQDGPFIIKKQ